ncbi:hypothetical protein [Ornithinicoccus hortensis]|uniref:HhH-GPD family protein n=1 Tax=Ornithinicoccus hortensis TaxID=82346 RepID=A0A542YUT7_9MICO|nr:hypothetical protein [Ornithinicoccus hortensis]TQL51830.1 hypothetical protein FB467_2994 [Ornithinicoccus hortensis]
MATSSDADALEKGIKEKLPQPWSRWPGGYPGEIEIALLDAVRSIRARYRTRDTGVRGATARYRESVGGGPLDDLTRLAAHDPEHLATIIGRQETSGRTKAEAIVEAASNLSAAGVRGADDLQPESHKGAYTRVRGLGKVTWEYFTMLLGKPGVKADTWVTRWVAEQIGRPVSSDEAGALVREVAGRMADAPDASGPLLTRLDHQIWLTARGRQRD